MFTINNLRTGNTERFTSEEFKRKIIDTTHSIYENRNVAPERSNLRPESLTSLLKDKLPGATIIDNIYLVTALGRINPDKETRYMILIDGDVQNPSILEVFKPYIPIYVVKMDNDKRTKGVASELSIWFRNTMGNGFSFSDIDYLITNEDYSYTVLIEEKIGKSGMNSVGYGQRISYNELVTDVIKQPNLLLYIFSVEGASLSTMVEFYAFNGNLTGNDKYTDSLNNIINRLGTLLTDN